MIFQAAASTAVPQEVLSRVVSTAKTEVENLASCDKIAGVASLDGSRAHCGKQASERGSATQKPGSVEINLVILHAIERRYEAIATNI